MAGALANTGRTHSQHQDLTIDGLFSVLRIAKPTVDPTGGGGLYVTKLEMPACDLVNLPTPR